jgi:hypothetical protein
MLYGKDYVYMMGKCSNLKNTWIGVVNVLCFSLSCHIFSAYGLCCNPLYSSRLFDSTKAMAFSNVPSRDWVTTSKF